MPQMAGPFTLALRFSGFDLSSSPKDDNIIKQVVKGVLCVFLCLLFAIALIATVTLESPPLGILWSDVNISMSSIVYSLSSGISIASWTRQGFLEAFQQKLDQIRLLRVVHNNKIDNYRYTCIKVGVVCTFLVATWTMAAFKDVLYYPATPKYNGTLPAKFEVLYWRNLFGAMPFVYVYMGLISSMATAIFWFVHARLQTELEYFNEELGQASKEQQLMDPTIFTSFGKRHQDLMSLLHYVDSHLGKLVSITGYFSAGGLANTLFILATYYKVFTIPYAILIVLWNITMLLLVFITIGEPGRIHGHMQRTKQILLGDVTLPTSGDQKILNSYQLFKHRCDNCSSVSIFGAWPIGIYTLDQVLLLVVTLATIMIGIAKLMHL